MWPESVKTKPTALGLRLSKSAREEGGASLVVLILAVRMPLVRQSCRRWTAK